MSKVEVFGEDIGDITAEWLTRWARSLSWLNDDQSVESFEVTKLDDVYYKCVVYGVSLVFNGEVSVSTFY